MFGFGKKKTEIMLVPMAGEIVKLETVKDPVFAEKMMGDGFAIDPTKGEVYSPFSGEILTAFPTGHALGLKADNGMEVLIHVGLDTVNLKGEGFEMLVSQGDRVEAGDLLIKVDLDKIQGNVPSIITPIIFTESAGKSFEVVYGSTEAKATDKILIK